MNEKSLVSDTAAHTTSPCYHYTVIYHGPRYHLYLFSIRYVKQNVTFIPISINNLLKRKSLRISTIENTNNSNY